MTSWDWSGRPPGGTESNISERLFNVLNNESFSNQSMARATGQNQSQNQLLAGATDYLKAMQMNTTLWATISYNGVAGCWGLLQPNVE